MDSSRYVGRVGTLAVALGIGFAMTTATGIALADDTGGTATTSRNDDGGRKSFDPSKRSFGGPSTDRSSPGGGSSVGSGTDSTATATDSGPARGTSIRSRLGTDNPVKKAIDNAGKRFDRSTERRNVTGGEAKVSPTSSNRIGRLAGRLKGKTNTKQVEAESKPAAPPSDPAGTVAPQSAPIVTTPSISPVATAESPTAAPAPARVIDRVAERFNAGAEKLTTAAKTLSQSAGRAGTSVDDTRSNPLIRPQAPNALPKLSTSSQTVTVALRDTAAATRQQVSTLRKIVNIDTAQTLNTASAAPISFANSITAPVSLAANESPALPKTTATTVVTSLLTVVGLSPLAGSGGPAVPAQSPLAWALAAWTRRAAEKDVSGENNEVQSAKDGETPIAEGTPMLRAYDIQLAAAVASSSSPDPGPSAAPTGLPEKLQVWSKGAVTGSPTSAWYVGGTDLGIMWDSGYKEGNKPVVFALFGDTFNESSMQTGWRNNVLFKSFDNNLTDGLKLDQAIVTPGGTGPGTLPKKNQWWAPDFANGISPNPSRLGAAQVILDPTKYQTGFGGLGTAYTMIPTAGIAVPNTQEGIDAGESEMLQYATVMSIKQWGDPGKWTTNYSAVAVSKDGGKTWQVERSSVRPVSGGNENFQQNALTYGNPDDPNSWVNGTPGEGDRYVYVYGTPSGRQGSAYLSRVPESQIADLNSYEYYNGKASADTNWVKGDPSKATVVFDSMEPLTSIFPESGVLGFLLKPVVVVLKFVYPAGFKPGGIFAKGGQGNVSEMSVQYNEYLDRYVVMYTDEGNNQLVMKVSETPQGAWSESIVVQDNISGYYAPMIHPLSGKPDAAGGDQYLYYNLSHWNGYNVDLMQTDLQPVKARLNV